MRDPSVSGGCYTCGQPVGQGWCYCDECSRLAELDNQAESNRQIDTKEAEELLHRRPELSGHFERLEAYLNSERESYDPAEMDRKLPNVGSPDLRLNFRGPADFVSDSPASQ